MDETAPNEEMSLRPAPRVVRFTADSRHLLLRAAQGNDASQVLECIEESSAEFRRFFSWAHLPQDLANQTARLEEHSTGFGSGGDLVYHLFDDGKPRLLGSFGLHRRSLNPKALELGYWVRTSCAGQGLATVASRVLVLLCFEHLGCNRVQCGYNEANIGSARVNERVGLSFEARVRFGEPQPTPGLTERGYAVTPWLIQTSMFLEGLTEQPWYGEVRASLSVSNTSPGS